ncbi:MAG: type II toxin-antitoxin system VapB family antitoxin [Dermatophilus congolensis]|nr:type II toxin-antitoxin system VapB family antitoxin [Dermatophilus congolensis]
MRTTVSIDDELLAKARSRAREKGMTLGQVVEAALRRHLARPEEVGAPVVPVFRGGGGPRPGIDLTSNRLMTEMLDEGRPLDGLR